MKTKTYQAQVKAVDDGNEGTFEALVSVFGNIDLVGDRVVKGAFAGSIKRWEESGDPIPVVFSHRWDDLDAHIGRVLKAEEREEGLWVKAQLDLDDPAAAKVHRLLKDRRLREFSFAYDVLDDAKDSNGVNELKELELHEVGPTLKGANPATQLLAAKAADLDEGEVARVIEVIDAAKSGRVLSAKSETKLRQAIDLVTEVLSAVESTSDEGDEAKSSVKDEDPAGGKSEERESRSPSHVRLLAEIDALDSSA
jgi:HK97 family phage prohead protease